MKNLWVPLKGNFSTPFAVWGVDLEQVGEMLKINAREEIARGLMAPLEIDAANYSSIEDLLSLSAAKLQSCDSEEVFKWLVSLGSKYVFQGFCYPFLDEKVAARVGPLAVDFLIKAGAIWSSGKPKELAIAETLNLLRFLRQQVDQINAYLETLRLLIRAKDRSIPVRRHSDRRIYQLGYGAQKKLIEHGYTSSTGQMATSIATHKYLAASVMRECGLPVPRHCVVRSIDQAKAVAHQIKFPLVMKPATTDKGIGVTVDIKNQDELTHAWQDASCYGDVLIEEMLDGFDHRLHIVDGKCIYVVKRIPPYVVGNGRDNLEQLVSLYAAERSNHPLYKKYGKASLSDPIVRSFLEKQNLSACSVIKNGQTVFLRSNSNLSTGGTLEDVTAVTHPDNLLLAERAARIIELDNAGIDFITTDIGKSWVEGGGICEVNPTPGILHDSLYPALLDYLFPKPLTGRIPIILLVGEVEILQHYVDIAVWRQERSGRAFGYIFGRKLHIRSEASAFIMPGENAQDLVTGLLADELVESAVIQINFKELAAGLDLHYFNLIIAVGHEAEISFLLRSDLICRCDTSAILVNPTIDRCRDFIDLLLDGNQSIGLNHFQS